MKLSNAQITEFLRKLQLGPLRGTDDNLYVPLDGVRGYRNVTSMDTLLTTLLTVEDACLLLSGFPGSGKTTELKRLQERLDPKREQDGNRPRSDARPTEVVLINGEELLDLFQPVSIADVLRVIAFCLDEAANFAKTGETKAKDGFVKKLVDFLKNTKIEFLGKINFSDYTGGAVNLMLEFKNSPSFREAAREAISQRSQAFLNMAKQSIKDSVEEIRKVKGENTRVVVIVDGLEKIQPIDEKDRERIEKSVEFLFVNQAPQLRIPCHVVYTFPLWLKYRYALAPSFDAAPLVLPMVKVWDRKMNEKDEAGYEAMKEVLRKRIDLSAVFGDESSALWSHVIENSGGYLRDMIRMVREIVVRGGEFPVDAACVHDIIDNVRQEYTQTLLGTDMDVLAEVAIHHKPPQDSGNRMATFARLYERRLILAYRNGNEWYNIHPLIKNDEMLIQAMQKVLAKQKPSPS